MLLNTRVCGPGLVALAILLGGCGDAGNATASAHDVAPPISATTTTAGASGSAVVDESASPKPYTDPQLTPITKADIDLYLDVMRAAAARVQNPTATDVAALHTLKDFDAQSRADVDANAPIEARAQAEQATLQAQININTAMQSGDMDKLRVLAAQEAKLGQGQQAAIHRTALPDDATMQLASRLSLGHADDVIVEERHLDANHWERVVDVIEEVFPPPNAAYGDCGGDCTPQLSAEQKLREQRHEAGVARNRKILAPYEKQIRAVQAVVRGVRG